MIEELLSWHPCQHPERVPDQHARFHLGCSACAIAYEAQQAPPPAGAFTGWHEKWNAETLEVVRTGVVGPDALGGRIES